MKRDDDFAERRKHIADLSDDELYARFWDLTTQVVTPLYELGRNNTTPSVERSVLLRMGVSSLDAKPIVDQCMDRGLSCSPRAKDGTKLLHCSKEGNKDGTAEEE